MTRETHDEYRAALALRHTPGIGPRTVKALALAYGSLVEAARRPGQWPERKLARTPAAEAFAARVWREPAEAEYAAAKSAGLRVLALTDPVYPERLREIPDPPALLYVRGETALLAAPCLAVVGARQCSRYGLSTARRVCEELSAAGVTVVSGMAYGIDRQAHLGGLAGIGSSVAVLGSGLDRVYPETNADLYRALCAKGLVVSEYAPGTMPEARNFPVRNRIIAGLSLGVWVVEAAPDSGSLITARLGMEQGREVFALPGRIDDPTFTGCNELIAQGAHPVSGAQCVLHTLRYQLAHHLERLPEPSRQSALPARPLPTAAAVSGEPSAAPAGPDAAQREDGDAAAGVLKLLAGQERLHIDAITRGLGRPPGSVCALLLELEVRGLVRQWPGMYYSLPG